MKLLPQFLMKLNGKLSCRNISQLKLLKLSDYHSEDDLIDFFLYHKFLSIDKILISFVLAINLSKFLLCKNIYRNK